MVVRVDACAGRVLRSHLLSNAEGALGCDPRRLAVSQLQSGARNLDRCSPQHRSAVSHDSSWSHPRLGPCCSSRFDGERRTSSTNAWIRLRHRSERHAVASRSPRLTPPPHLPHSRRQKRDYRRRLLARRKSRAFKSRPREHTIAKRTQRALSDSGSDRIGHCNLAPGVALAAVRIPRP